MSILTKAQEIIQGWGNVIFSDPAIEEEAKRRASICGACKYNVNNKCQKCGCPLIAKTRSPNSKCPISKW